MRIAYVIADRGIGVFGTKGASIHVQEMVKAFGDLDHDVHVFAARVGPETVALNAEITKVKAAVSLGGESSQDLKAIAREKYSMAVSKEITEALCVAHQKKQFDLIYERYALFSTAGVDAAEHLGIPCLVEVNSPLLLEQQRYRVLSHVDEAQQIEHEVFKRADVLLPVSSQVADYIASKAVTRSKIHVVPNGVDVRCFHPNVEAKAVCNSEQVIGFVGSLKAWHGIEVLLDAFKLLRAQDHECHLLIVGDGPLREWIHGYASGAGLSNNITVTGWVEYERLPGLLASMQVAVAPYPKIEDFYFSPLKLYEYLAMGVPVVASDIGQIAEFLLHEGNALLTQPGQASNLATQIARLFNNPVLARQLVCGGVATAAERTWAHNAELVIGISQSFRIATPISKKVAQ